MADLAADAASMDDAARLIAAIARATLGAGDSAAAAMSTAAAGISHPALRSAVDDARGISSTAHRALAGGITALGGFAIDSGAAYDDADRRLGQAIVEPAP